MPETDRATRDLARQLGVLLFREMQRAGMDYPDVAAKLGVSPAEVRRYMLAMVDGRPGRRTLAAAAMIAAAIGCWFTVELLPREQQEEPHA